MFFTATTDDNIDLQPEPLPQRQHGPRDILMTPYFARHLAQRAPLGRHYRRDGDLLVTALWVAHRAARRLARRLKKHRPDGCPQIRDGHCETCLCRKTHCQWCEAMEIAADLVRARPVGCQPLGAAADSLLAILPWVDVRKRIAQLEAYHGKMFAADVQEDADLMS